MNKADPPAVIADKIQAVAGPGPFRQVLADFLVTWRGMIVRLSELKDESGRRIGFVMIRDQSYVHCVLPPVDLVFSVYHKMKRGARREQKNTVIRDTFRIGITVFLNGEEGI